VNGRVAHEVQGDVDGLVRLHGVSWADYQHLLRMRGDHSAPRITYLEGEVEIMSPSRSHESIKGLLGRLVEVYCFETGLEFSTYGSWTIKDRPAQRGAEPDECYVFGEEVDPKRPHLAIEVEWTEGRIDKLEVYRKLGVRELWYWRRGRVQPYRLHGQRYRPMARSKALPGIDLEELARFAEVMPTSRAIRGYREALRKRA
jgi:Uma2 family endonuclease